MTSLDRGAFWVFPNQRCQGVTIGRTHARTASTDPGAAVTQSPYVGRTPSRVHSWSNRSHVHPRHAHTLGMSKKKCLSEGKPDPTHFLSAAHLCALMCSKEDCCCLGPRDLPQPQPHPVTRPESLGGM